VEDEGPYKGLSGAEMNKRCHFINRLPQGNKKGAKTRRSTELEGGMGPAFKKTFKGKRNASGEVLGKHGIQETFRK